jgi:3-hydroxyisobutyrate dehydrogenase-like beta-hydroxyacid dehydrogenase
VLRRPMNLGFLGLGHMGQAMAQKLLRSGHSVTVWNRTRGKGEPLTDDGARIAGSPAEAAQGAQVVLSSLANDDAVTAAVLGLGTASGPDPLIAGLAPGAAHLSLSTISPALSKRLAQAHEAAGQRYAAAPVLGRPAAAERGELVVLAAGPDALIDECQPLFDAIGKKTHRLGPEPERANLAKLSANLVMASMLEVFGEAFALAESYGLEALQLLGILEDSMLSAEALDGYGKRIASHQFEPAGFRLALGLKDVDLALAASEAAALQMPFASVLRDRFLVAMARGLEGQDWSAVARTLPHKRAA